MQLFLTATFAAVAALLGYLFWRCFRQVRGLESRYAGIIDLDAELKSRRLAFDAALQAERSRLEETREATEAQLMTVKSQIKEAEETLRRSEAVAAQKRGQLENDYRTALAQYKKLQSEVNLLEENLEDISFGIYKPHFDFETPEDYKTALEHVRDQQRALIKEGKAAVCRVEWTVGESKQEGARMQKQYLKLMLRAFNGESDAAVASVSWNNDFA